MTLAASTRIACLVSRSLVQYVGRPMRRVGRTPSISLSGEHTALRRWERDMQSENYSNAASFSRGRVETSVGSVRSSVQLDKQARVGLGEL